MATRNPNTNTATVPAGRALAVHMLRKMQKANEGYYIDVRESREALYKGLCDFTGLPEAEARRFVATLNEYISAPMQGMVFDPRHPGLLDGRLERHSARLSTITLNERSKQRRENV